MDHWRINAGLVTRLGKVPLLFLLALSASVPLEGCSSEPLDGGRAEQIGTLGLNLNVAPGVTLDSVTYTITGNGFSKTGSIDVSGTATISGTIGGIPAGSDYIITLTSTSRDGGATFTGSARFNVTAGGTTSVTIHLRGSGSSGTGSVTVNGTINVAPVIDELTVTPLTVAVGSNIALTGVGRDPDAGPSPVTYYWSSTGGVIDNPIAQNATLTSATPGTFTLKLTVADGDAIDTATTTVTFVESETGGSGGAGGEGGGGSGEGKRPNILLIIADDVGAESVSLYPELVGDSGAVPIPNLEALAANGLVFDNAWSSPACSMTRGTIVSGQYGHRTGVTAVNDVLPTSTVTLFDRITAESPSYAQALFGKYHLGGSNAANALPHVRELGIPTYRGLLGGAISNYYEWITYDIDAAPFSNTTYATTAITDYAIDYIARQEATRPNDPWFVYQAYNAAHSPFQVPPRELHSVNLGDLEPGTVANTLPTYKAILQSLDTSIGRLLENVDLEETTVIFIGDNGTPANQKDTGTGIRASKGSVYEGGVRVPLVVAGAGVTRRGREDALVVSSDLYATILSLTGLPVSHVENSYSIKPLFADETASSGRTHSFSETANAQNQRYAIKDNRYKLLSNNGVLELYDLVADPLESNDLYASEAHAAARESLEAEIAALKPQAPAGYFP